MRPDLVVLALSVLSPVTASVINGPRSIQRIDIAARDDEHELYKRRGGGGGGGRGGGGSGGGKSGGSKSSSSKSSGSSKGSSKSSSSKSGSSSSGSGSSKSGSSSSSGSKSSKSNSGGSSRSGSGPQPNYGGGRYYGGGASAPYRAGGKSASGIVPFVLLGSALAFWPGVWLWGAYIYPYHYPYHYYNHSSAQNETRDVICGCAQYAVCGCDENNSTAYYDELVGNGSWAALNKTLVNVAEVNGTMTILINGTLPNGTTLQSDTAAAGDSMRTLAQAAGFWPAILVVIATVFLA